MFIATLIAAETLDHAQILAATERLAGAGCEPASPAWLAPGKAADIAFASDPDAARRALENALGPVDIVVQPRDGRAKRLLVADMDSTMITVECIDELADYAGIKPQIAAITERAMRGELDFEAALDERVALLRGLPVTAIERCLSERVRLTPGARTLVRTMRAHGARTVLVSGGFTAFAEPVAAAIGFEDVVANRLVSAGAVLDGTVERPIVGAATKEAVLRDRAEGLSPAETLAVGDGANDLAMIRAAGLGVAYRAKPVVAAAADARIDHGDLTALLYAQGIAPAQWVAD